jgi:hypothetical protein
MLATAPLGLNFLAAPVCTYGEDEKVNCWPITAKLNAVGSAVTAWASAAADSLCTARHKNYMCNLVQHCKPASARNGVGSRARGESTVRAMAGMGKELAQLGEQRWAWQV